MASRCVSLSEEETCISINAKEAVSRTQKWQQSLVLTGFDGKLFIFPNLHILKITCIPFHYTLCDHLTCGYHGDLVSGVNVVKGNFQL